QLPRKWDVALTGLIRLAFDGVSEFSLAGWPSEERSALVFSRIDDCLEVRFAGAATTMKVASESFSTDRFQALRG
ncbi:hypothetical protein, partial [Neorhizobium alkalisoli]|uniref:hypothetical protein n=1 Tax=Neorhizobium alkalisoli TaxID=528178 RepID=UPI00197BA7AA